MDHPSGISDEFYSFLSTETMHYSKVVSTHLWNTPLNLHQQAISRDSFHSGRCGGIAERVCSTGVW